MSLGTRLKQYRTGKKLSQEKVAELLGVSRQAVTKWENDQSIPSMKNIGALAELYEISIEELRGNPAGDRKNRIILRRNLTILAIILQSAALNVCIHLPPEGSSFAAGDLLAWKLIPLVLSSAWMANALREEKDPRQYWKNVKIELLYCAVQFGIAVAAYYSGFRNLGTAALAAVCLFYLFVVNPRYMHRRLVQNREKNTDTTGSVRK